MSIELWKNDPFGTYRLQGIDRFLQLISSALPNNFFFFKLALVLRKLVLRKGIEVVDVDSIAGLKMRLYPLDNIGDRLSLFMPWYFESKEFNFISNHCQSGDTFIDIGANTGYYTLLASQIVGAEGSVLSFEPNPVVFNRLKFNLENNDNENIQAFNYGLANRDGEFELKVNPKNLGQGTIKGDSEKEDFDVRKVECRVLFEVLQKLNIKKLDVMKIDVEQAEPMVLNPFFSSAPRSLWPNYVLIESSDEIPFHDLGYELLQKTKSNSIFKLKR